MSFTYQPLPTAEPVAAPSAPVAEIQQPAVTTPMPPGYYMPYYLPPGVAPPNGQFAYPIPMPMQPGMAPVPAANVLIEAHSATPTQEKKKCCKSKCHKITDSPKNLNIAMWVLGGIELFWNYLMLVGPARGFAGFVMVFSNLASILTILNPWVSNDKTRLPLLITHGVIDALYLVFAIANFSAHHGAPGAFTIMNFLTELIVFVILMVAHKKANQPQQPEETIAIAPPAEASV